MLGIVDQVFARIGASDELHAGMSTFMVEMTETASICHYATPNSLIILDEIGSGTSTLDGLSLAWAIAEHLSTRGCRTLFATHYHELTQLAQQHASVTNLNVTYDLGFWLRSHDYSSYNPLHKLTKISVSGGGLKTGTPKEY